jgi:N-acetyl-gamma-glutamyl-phosphate reductase
VSLTVALLGANGYGGAGLIERLRAHPEIGAIRYASRTFAGRPLSDAWPQWAGLTDARFVTPDEALEGADVAFLATPHGATAPWVRAALAAGARVIDLSADSRLDAASYARWYGAHPHPDDLASACYGLVEAHRDELPGALLVAAPGCNATAVSLALLPYAEAGLLDPAQPPVCTVLAGASGAGRATSAGLHFSELDGSARPYKVAGTHRHLAEIEATLGRARDQGARHRTHAPFAPLPVSFTPQLVPLVRGILATCTFRPSRDVGEGELAGLAQERYRHDPMVHVQPELPEVKAVAGSDRALASIRYDARTGLATAFAVIDNLGKGAAGQAVQAFNVAFGFPETTALHLEGRWP